MKKCFKKYDKIIIALGFFFLVFLMSWFIKTGNYNNGVYVEGEYGRAGIYTFFYYLFGAFSYKIMDIFFIFVVGGCYGILSETKGYRKLVDKTIDFIHGKEKIVFAILVFLIGVFTSVSTQPFVVFAIIPFIITVFLGDGKDRMTAFLAAFGGIFVGLLGMTYGTFGFDYLNQYLLIKTTDQIILKIVIFILMYALFVGFGILHMNKYKKAVDEIDYDLFATEELDESGVKKNKKTKVWPTILVLVLGLLVLIVAYLSWNTGFNVKFFNDLFEKFNTKFLVVNEVPLAATILGTNSESAIPFGSISDVLFASFLMLLVTIVMAIINKQPLNKFFDNFGYGMKKVSKVAIVYALCFAPIIFATQYPWAITFVNSIFGDGKFNIFKILFAGFSSQTLLIEQDLLGVIFGKYLATTFLDKVVITSIVWRFGLGLSLLVAPTSFILMSGLTYLEIPYTKWLKYVWKVALSSLFIFALAMFIVVYL